MALKSHCFSEFLWKLVLLTLLLSACVFASPLQIEESCSKAKCAGKPGKFDYRPRTVYNYRYETDVVSYVQGTDEAQSRLHLSLKANLEFRSYCEVTLRVSEVSLRDSEPLAPSDRSPVPGEVDIKQPLENYPLSFAFDDGRITSLCPDPRDPAWSLNIKRGILSALQNTMRRLDLDHEGHDVDVTGSCRSNYRFEGVNGSTFTIIKSRDLSSCSQRYGHVSSLLGVPYHFPGGYGNLPLVNSTSECRHTILGKVISQAECWEQHTVRPFSNHAAGAVTSVGQSVTLIGSEPLDEDPEAPKISKRTSLVFEYHVTSSTKFQLPANVAESLKELCKITEDGIDSGAALHFGRFVEGLRSLAYPSIASLLEQSENLCQDRLANKLLLHGLISAGSSAAVAAMRDEVATGSVDSSIVMKWIGSLGFIANPDQNHLVAALPLLDLPSSVRPPNSALAVTGLARRVCMTSDDCSSIPEMKMLLSKLSHSLGSSCESRNRAEREEIILTLKALGNIGVAMTEEIPFITNCYKNLDAPAEVRLSAIESLRNSPCHIERPLLKKILHDVMEDSEIRIQAYLGAMRCPSYETILFVKDLLEQEEVNQVGSFIWSHLKNLAKTASPSKVALQGLVTNQKFSDKFNTDVRKFSRHFESSLLFDELNAAAGIESHVIFSTKSYIPRSAMLNLTVDLFGQSLNLLEIDGRVEGLEKSVESLFAHGGLYHNNHIKDFLKSLRPKRKAEKTSDLDFTKIAEIDRQSTAAAAAVFDQTPQFSLSTKILGNEVRYLHFEGLDELKDLYKGMNPLGSLQNLMNGKDVSYSDASQFLDWGLVVPLAAGLPLNLTLKGQAIVDIRSKIKADLSGFLTTGQGEIDWSAKPSASVNIEAAMKVDAKIVQTGIKLSADLHTSVATSGQVSVKGFELLDLKISFPQDKSEIINVKSEILLEHRGSRIALAGIRQNRVEFAGCTRGLPQRVLGLKLCAEIAYPNASTVTEAAHFPLSGPAKLVVTLEKADQDVTGYQFLHKIENNNKRKAWTLTFQPKGSRETKEVGLKILWDSEKGHGSMYMLMPTSSYEVKGDFKWNDELREIHASIEHAGKQLLSAKGSLNKNSDPKDNLYLPRLHITYGDKKLVNIDGDVRVVEKKRTYKYDANLETMIGSWDSSVKGYFLLDWKSYVSNFTIERKGSSSAPQIINLEMKLSNGTTKALRQYDAYLDIGHSLYSQYNFVGSWKFQSADDHVDNQITLSSGTTVQDSTHKLTLTQSLTYAATLHGRRLKTRLEASLPSQGLDLLAVLNHEKTDMKTDNLFIGRYAKDRQVEAGLVFERKAGLFFHANAGLNFSLPQRPVIQITGNLQENPGKIYRLKANGLWGSATDFDLQGTYINEGQNFSRVHDLDFEVNGSSFPRLAVAAALYSGSKSINTKWQSSYGKDTFAVTLDLEKGSPNEWKISSNVGYLNYLHSGTVYINVEQGFESSIDIHIDRIRDIRLDFISRNRNPSKPREILMELKWDANRDPSQKISLKTSVFPTNPETKDLNATLHFSYPNRVIKGSLSTITEDDGKAAVLTLELHPGQVLELSSHYRRENKQISAEMKLLTPYDRWRENRAIFTSDTTNRNHASHLRLSWASNEFVEASLSAEAILEEQKNLEASFVLTSSLEWIQTIKAAWNTSLTSSQLENSLQLKWRDDKQLLLQKTFSWNLEDQLKLGTRISLQTPFASLSKAQLQLEHNTQWKESLKSETTGSLNLDNSEYTLLLKGENPVSSSKWEAAALLTTPHAKYESLGLSAACDSNETRPSLLITLDWPDNRIRLSGNLNFEQQDSVSGLFALQTPFEPLKVATAEGSLTTSEPLGFVVNGSIGWNNVHNVSLSSSFATSPDYTVVLGARLRTTFQDYENYGVNVEAQFDEEALELKGLARLIYQSVEAGLKVGGQMTDTGIHGTTKIEIPHWPELGLSFSYVDDNVTTVDLTAWAGEKTIVGNLTMARGDSNIDAVAIVTTPFEVLPRLNLRVKGDIQTDEEEQLYDVSVGARWTQMDSEEKDVGVHGKYRSLSRQDEATGEQRELTEVTLDLRTPWGAYKNLGGTLKSRSAGPKKAHNADLILGSSKYSLGSLINFDEQKSVLIAVHQTETSKLNFRLNSTWLISEEEGIVIEGTLETPYQNYKRLPWKIIYNSKDIEPENEDGDYLWERSISGQVNFSPSRAAVLGVRITPSEIDAKLSTPFPAVRNAALRLPLLDFEEKSWNVSSEITVNEKTILMAGQITWPEEGAVPEEAQITLVSSWDALKQANLVWNLKTSENEGRFFVSGSWNDKETQLSFDYILDVPKKINLNLKLTTPVVGHSLYSAEFVMEQTEEGYSGKLMLATPSEVLKNLRWTLEAIVKDASEYRLNTGVDLNDFSATFEAKWIPIETGGVETGIKFAGLGHSGSLSALLSYDAESFRHLKLELNSELNGDWRLGLSSVLKQSDWLQLDWNTSVRYGSKKWVLTASYDVVDIDKLYRHRLVFETMHEKVKYSFYGRLEKSGLKREGEIGIDWQAVRPLEVKLTAQTKTKLSANVNAELVSPWADEPLLVVQFDIDMRNSPVTAKLEATTHLKKFALSADVKYNSLSSLGGTISLQTPWESLPNVGLSGNLQDTKSGFNTTGSFKWSDSNNFDIHVSHRRSPIKWINKNDVEGAVTIASSFVRLPQASLRYSSKHPSPTESQLDVDYVYNHKAIFNMVFNTSQSSSAGLDKEAWQLETRNIYITGGASYAYVYEYSAGQDGLNLPTQTSTSVAVYDIDNPNVTRLTADYVEKVTFTGESYALRMCTPTRTVELSTHYDLPDGAFKHGSEFRLRPDARFGYDIDIENHSTDTLMDYVFTTVFHSPQRSMGVAGTLRKSERHLRALSELVWDLKRKDSAAKISINWENITQAADVKSHRVRVAVAQGQLPSEVALVAELHSSATKPLDARVELQYAGEDERNAVLTTVTSYANGGFHTELSITHPATQLDVRQVTYFERSSSRANFSHLLQYLRPEEEPQSVELSAFLDTQQPRIFLLTSVPGLRITQEGHVISSTRDVTAKYEIQVDENIPRVMELYVNKQLPFATFVTQYNPEETKGLHLKAGVPNKRQVVLEFWNQEAEEKSNLIDFYFQLNHSHLLTSKATWRPMLAYETLELLQKSWTTGSQAFSTFADDFGNSAIAEVLQAVLAISDDMSSVTEPGLVDFIQETELLVKDFEQMRQDIIDGYHNNSFHAKTIYELVSAIYQDIPFGSYAQSFVSWFEKTGNRITSLWTDSSNTFSQWLDSIRREISTWIPTISRWFQNQWTWNSYPTTVLRDQTKNLLNVIALEYDEFVKKLHMVLFESFEDIYKQLVDLAEDSINAIYGKVRPALLNFYVSLDNAFWNTFRNVLDYVYEQRDAVIESSFFRKFSQLVEDLRSFYTDIINNRWSLNIRKYTARISEFIKQKYESSKPFFELYQYCANTVQQWWKTLLEENTDVRDVVEAAGNMYDKTLWFLDYLEIGQNLRKHSLYLIEKGLSLRQTAIEATEKFETSKTKFIFTPEKGLIELEQRLPFPWVAFNEKPKFDEIPEFKKVKGVLAAFSPSNSTFMDLVYKYLPSEDVANWIPPFKGIATITGLSHYVTFDGRYYEFPGTRGSSVSRCSYLLSRDVYSKNYALGVKYTSTRGKAFASVLQLSIDEAQWDLDLTNLTVQVAGFPRVLPTEERGTLAYYENGKFVVTNPSKGISIECLQSYETCTFTLSGWYHSKVAGLLGTLDNEPINDQTRPGGKIEPDLSSLIRSWELGTDQCPIEQNHSRKTANPDPQLVERCSEYFTGVDSSLRRCFPFVDPSNYQTICSSSGRKGSSADGCHAAAAYVQACQAAGVSVRMPLQCLKCSVSGGSALLVGETKSFKEEKPDRPSSDVVIIIEANKCNENAHIQLGLAGLLANLEKELNAQKIIKNRYAVVVFGGKEPFDDPRVRTLQGQEFVPAKDVDNLLHNIKYADGSGDVLLAVDFASSKLSFRPGASRTFILVPCSACELGQTKVQYGKLHQTLLDSDITLHVLTHAEFQFTKARAAKQFLGIDASAGYTRKDFKARIPGDADLKRQAKLPKATLGQCAMLALETNGSIFEVSKLSDSRRNSQETKRAISVWSRRVASTGVPAPCHNCVCALKNRFETRLQCVTCAPRKPLTIDWSFLVEHSASSDAKPATQRSGKSRPKEAFEVADKDDPEDSQED